MKKGTYFNLDTNTHKRLKIFALANDITMTEALEQLINTYCTLEKEEVKEITNEEVKQLK